MDYKPFLTTDKNGERNDKNSYNEILDRNRIKIAEGVLDRHESMIKQLLGDDSNLTETTDSNIAYMKQVPANALNYAELLNVGGMCQKVNQFVNFDNDVASTSWGGAGTYSITNKKISVVVNASQSIISAGVLNLGIHVKNGHKYFVYSSLQAGVGFFLYDNVTAQMFAFNAITSLNQEITNTLRLNYYKESLAEQTTYTFNLAFVDLSAIWPTDTPTATSDARIQWLMSYLSSHPEYDAGSILTAPVTKVVSKGFNIWDEEWEVGRYYANGTPGAVTDSIRSKVDKPISVLPNTAYYFKGNFQRGACWYDDNDNFIRIDYPTNTVVTSPSNARYLRLSMGSAYGTTYNHDICINVSNASMNGTYMPYHAPIEYPIPAEVQALEGYGYGLSAECNNKTSYEGKAYDQAVARAVLATLPWQKEDASTNLPSGHTFSVRVSNFQVVRRLLTAIESKYISSASDADTQGVLYYGHGYYALVYADENISTVQELVASFGGKDMYYELATPVETDISEYLPYDDYIEVEAGGTVTFENTNEIDVPSEIVYLEEVSE